jgi:D-3-phosphoglycerate dehydrogenase
MDGLIAGTEPLTKMVLDSNKKLKVISRLGVGMDNVDIEAAKARSIKVYNTPNGPTDAVAELTLGLLLNVLRQIGSMDRNIRRGVWKKQMGNLLLDKKVGIIGFGRIGRRLAQLLAPFNCKISFYDPYFSAGAQKDALQVKTLEELIKTSDIISLHLPYSKENHYLLDRKRIEAMNTGAVLINASRGKLVDEKALLDGLTKGNIAGAGFDAFEDEPYKGPLCQLDNVVLTPHIGSYAKESRVQMETDAVNNLLKGLGLIPEAKR